MLEHKAVFPEIDRHARDADAEAELHALDSVMTPLASAPVPSTKFNRTPQAHHGFQLPRSIWVSMLACYGAFFTAIFIATGDSGYARFAIVVSVLYTAIYFGVARIGALQAGAEERSPLDRGMALQTWTGAMDTKSVRAQVLVVPMCVALFGVCMMVVILTIA